jgi:hypothetical protein
VGELAEYLARRAPRVAAGPMAPEHVEQLRALGYAPPLDAAAQGETREDPPPPRTRGTLP